MIQDPAESDQDQGTITAESLKSAIRRAELTPLCSGCHSRVSRKDMLLRIVMGAGTTRLCLSCMGETLGFPEESLRTSLQRRVMSRDCFREAWLWAETGESGTVV